MLRSASDMVPLWRARASVSACSGLSSSVTVLPTTLVWPSFSFGAWSMARTRTLLRITSELTISAADKAVARSRRRPRLPLHSLGGHRLAKTDVGLRDKNVHGLQRDRFGGGRLVADSTREICGNPAGNESDGQDDNACGIHTLL